MNIGKILAYIAAGVLIIFGILALLGSTSANGQPGWVFVGLICIACGFGIIWFAGRTPPASAGSQNVTLKVDLPGNVALDSLKCQSCGGALKADNIKMVAGAPTVSCPYCNTTYQLTEDPKW